MELTFRRSRSLSHKYGWLSSRLAQLTDVGATALAAYVVHGAYLKQAAMSPLYAWGTTVGALLVAIVLPALGIYNTWRGRVLSPLLFKLLTGYAIVGLICTSLLFLTGLSEAFSRVWLVVSFTVAFLISLSARAAVYPLLKRYRMLGRNRRQVVLIGDARSCARAVHHLQREPTAGFDIGAVYLMGDDSAKELAGQKLNWLPYSAARVHDIHSDEVWICLPLAEGERVKQTIADLGVTAANVRFMPDMRDFRLINHNISHVANLYLLDMSCSPISGSAHFLKAVEDRLIAALILVAISPILLIVAIGVKLSSPGPIFYRQERVSWNGKPFDMLKFRSMPVDSEKSGVTWGGAQQKQTTRFGAFIRRTSLDELPQFINVLKGNMSIVGPRPERTIFVERFKHEIPGYMQKHLMKAGITGWAQINGWRGDTDLEKRIECDLWYIENWSLMLDLKIILLTVFKGFVNKNAY
ncbi:undecaprenyl-phosphate glucose phosphotransferase [Stutzerimonas azotifigens]|uniref:undecaprenyl-phosphate glucose phosphotransferase n=1 Tax=Stutzerimonas azotifigens TaxID=291995 RepID=UPI0004293EBB|nr:undecaprenyl-phosphate glucose phosphotransferase [Stutzerimonas azotifigens]